MKTKPTHNPQRRTVGKRRLVTAVAALFAAASVPACGRDSDAGLLTGSTERPETFRYVTGDALAALNAQGLFQQTLHEPAPGSRPEITQGEARLMAMAWVRDYGETARVFLEPQYGGVIEPDQLGVCGRTFYAASSFEPLPAEIPDPQQRMFGPWWLVQLCSGASKQVLLAVSAYNVGILTNEGEFQYPRHAGTHFLAYGIPTGRLENIIVPPEDAVRVAAGITRVNIGKLPELHIGNGGVLSAAWRLELETSVQVRRVELGRIDAVEVVYVGGSYNGLARPREPYVGVAAVNGRQQITFDYVRNIVPDAPIPRQLLYGQSHALVRQGSALELEHIAPVEEIPPAGKGR